MWLQEDWRGKRRSREDAREDRAGRRAKLTRQWMEVSEPGERQIDRQTGLFTGNAEWGTKMLQEIEA